MKHKVNWNGATYKDWIGLSASPIFWIASLVCFVLGLSFKTGTGIYFPGTSFDITVLFSLALGFANTAIQIVGNDTDREDLGMALFLMWGASYMLGIGSNVNFLGGVIGLSNPILQFLVCWGLGIMIEVAPERLLVKFLRAIRILEGGSIANSRPVAPIPQQPPLPSQNYNHRPDLSGHGVSFEGLSRDERHAALRQVQELSQKNQNSKPKYHALGMDDSRVRPRREDS